MKKVIFLIPARKNSKGFKFKNRKLIDFTINSIPMEYRSQVYISTDDDVIKERVRESNINVIVGPEGGFEKSEIQYAKSLGIKPVSLGRRILRADTAGIAAVSCIMYEFDQFMP